MRTPVGYQELSEALSRIGFTEEAAGYHGTLCGSLCVRRPEDIDLLRLLDFGDEPARPDARAEAALARLREQSLHALEDSEMIFMPLLPDDEAELAPRVRALASWCEGFLFGLASRSKLDLKKCSEDAREILRDFTQFTQASAGSDEGELEENAYAELVEYVRVGAQLIFMELRHPPMPDPNESTSIH
jgi:uncharacterized protein